MRAVTMTYDGCQKFLLHALYHYPIDQIKYDQIIYKVLYSLFAVTIQFCKNRMTSKMQPKQLKNMMA